MIGDAVNIASRLCDDAEPNEIRLTQAVVDRLTNPPSIARTADVELRGKRQPVVVYRVVG